MMSLLDVLARSTAVLLFGLLLMPVLRRSSAALRHWVLLCTLIFSAFVPAAMWLMPDWPTPVTVRTLVSPLPPPVAQSVESLVTQAVTRERAAPTTASSVFSETTLLVSWGVGSLVSLTALGVGLWRLRQLDLAARVLTGGTWVETLARHVGANGHGRQVRLKLTNANGLLLVWGASRPTIIIPPIALSWPRDRVDAVLRHELAHVRRHDWTAQIVSEAVRTIFWFNPLVWVACARLRAECEVACDDDVIRAGENGAAYAAHVVAIAQDLNAHPWLPAPAIVRPSTLERRVRAMLDKSRNRQPLSRRWRTGALAVTSVLTVAVAAIAAQSFVSLSGTIVDPSNGVLPGVTLVLTNEETQAKYEIKTDNTGRYEFVGLPPGNYRIDAAVPGFSRFTGRIVVASQNVQQDLTLTIGQIEETITVREGAEQPPADPERARKMEEFKRKRAQAVTSAARPSIDSGAARIGGNIRVPLKLRDVWPQYPTSMAGTEGVVVLHAKIGTTGSVEDIEVASTTHPDFAQSAIDAVRQWEFDATMLNGEPIVTPMRVTVNYRIAR